MKQYRSYLALFLCIAIFCLLATGCNQSKYPSQTIRMDSMFSPGLHNTVTVVQSGQDLEAFTQRLTEQLQEYTTVPNPLQNTTYSSAIEKYDTAFFADHALLMVHQQGTSVDEYIVTKLKVKDNQGELHLQEISRPIAYADVNVCDIVVIEIPHDLIADSYTVTVEY